MCGCSSTPLASGLCVAEDNVSIACVVSNSVIVFNLLDGSSQVVELPNFISKVDYQGIIRDVTFVEKTKIALEELANIFINNGIDSFNIAVNEFPDLFIDATLSLEIIPSIYVNDNKQLPLYIELPPAQLNLSFPYLVNLDIKFIGLQPDAIVNTQKTKSFFSVVSAFSQILPLFFGSFISLTTQNVVNPLSNNNSPQAGDSSAASTSVSSIAKGTNYPKNCTQICSYRSSCGRLSFPCGECYCINPNG